MDFRYTFAAAVCVCVYVFIVDFSMLALIVLLFFASILFMAGTKCTEWMRKKCTSSLNKITTNGFPWRWHSHPSHTHFFRHTLAHPHKFQWQINFQAATIFIVKVAVVAIYSVILFLLELQQNKKKMNMPWHEHEQCNCIIGLQHAQRRTRGKNQKKKLLSNIYPFLSPTVHRFFGSIFVCVTALKPSERISIACKVTLKHALQMWRRCCWFLVKYLFFRNIFATSKFGGKWRIRHRIESLNWVHEIPFNFHLWHRIGVASFSYTKSHKW